MTKRTESNTPSTKRRDQKRGASKRRRMMMESLEQRQLLAAQVFDLPTVTLPVLEQSRDIGSIQAFAMSETETNSQFGLNDSLQTANFVPLGTGPGQQDTIDLTGALPFTTVRPPISLPDGTIIPQSFSADLDYFAFDLRAGDILDIATLSAAGSFTVFNPDGSFWFGIDDNQAAGGGVFYPPNSPLQTLGNAVYAQVIPADGRYSIVIAPNNVQSNYTVGLRVYRPSVESLPIGAQQYIFLDFDGSIVPTTVLDAGTGIPTTGIFRIPSLQDSLPFLGLQDSDPAVVDRLIDLTIEETVRQMDYLGIVGNAGDFDRTGTPGDYGVTILNSRDHVDPGNHPLVTKVRIGGPIATIGLPAGVLGVSTSIDIGNFTMNEDVFVALDGVVGSATFAPIANNASVLESTADVMAFIITHEVGHAVGMRHTEPGNTTDSIADAIIFTTEGPDGIYGTVDDVQANWRDDQFSIAEGIVGTNQIVNALANTLVTGTVGGTVTGRVFNDINQNGSSVNDPGLAGVTVFVDLDGDGILDSNEFSTVSGADGTFSLSAANGSASIVAITPSQFAPTTPTTVAASFGAAGSTVAFGFSQVVPDITGTKFADLNDNGLFDANESGIGGVYIYLDLDGDDRPDLGEPAAVSAADGTYSINFPGPGTYTIREVLEPGFTQTFPVGGEHTVTFDGSTLGNNYNFGNSPSRDYGDAPDDGGQFNYRTLAANDGASHGLVAGLTLGAVVDRDLDGAQSADAQGDDRVGAILANGSTLDDEDGVVLIAPLSTNPDTTDPTANTIRVTTTNDTGTAAYLQAWVDFDGNGDFDGVGEQIATNMLLGTGTITLPVPVPSNGQVGTTYARFRYSQTRNLDWFGAADSGEVEDYTIPISGSPDIAVADNISVSRNSLGTNITSQILANDFQTFDNPISIVRLQKVVDPNGAPLTRPTRGTVVLNGGQVTYTPPNGYIGLDRFAYVIRDTFGTESTAIVTINVTFLSAVPIAVDDIFDVPEGGSVNRALNVLDNDVPSTAGGLTIISVQPGDRGGTISTVGGGQSIRYTPLAGFNGTEQFVYNVQDASGQISSATVTVNILPGSRNDDIVDFTIDILDTDNQRPISSIGVGEEFFVRVYVEDLENTTPDGVASAFLDLLYTDTQVATLPRPAGSTSGFNFDIDFGEFFRGLVVNDFNTNDPNDTSPFQQGNAAVPGLLNEIGALQTTIPNRTHDVRVELFTVRMQATSPGIAIFQGDPSNNIVSETIVVGSNTVLTPSQQRFGSAELEILPSGTVFSSAIDDSFPKNIDSLGQSFANTGINTYRLNVLENDNLGLTGNIIDRQILAQGGFGQASFNDNNTPLNLNDDYVDYVPDVASSGFESFTYTIVTADGIRSTAEVTLAVNDSLDDQVDINFVLVDEAGSQITSVSRGQTFGVQVNVKDIRPAGLGVPTSVFAGYLDVLYSSGLIATTDTTIADRNQVNQDFFDFDVTFQDDSETGFRVNAAVGTAQRQGIIDEFGSFLNQPDAQILAAPNGNLMATIYFQAIATGTARVVGGPADSFPFQDTLLSRENNPVPVNRIRYDVLEFNITGPSGEFVQNPVRPADVNNDGDLSPLDALLVMNRLAVEASNVQGEEAASSQHYLDVSGEGDLSPLDALMVLNALSDARAQSQSNSAQGELVSDNLQLAEDVSSARVTDAEVSDSVFTELNQRPVFGSAAGSDFTPSASAQIASQDGATDDNEDDDLLNLLADDLLDLGS